jgi:hypothetical protein
VRKQQPKQSFDRDYRSVGIVEGFIPTKDPEEVRSAWQHLVDTGLAWRLQGWFGRTAAAMIAAGELNEPDGTASYA